MGMEWQVRFMLRGRLVHLSSFVVFFCGFKADKVLSCLILNPHQRIAFCSLSCYHRSHARVTSHVGEREGAHSRGLTVMRGWRPKVFWGTTVKDIGAEHGEWECQRHLHVMMDDSKWATAPPRRKQMFSIPSLVPPNAKIEKRIYAMWLPCGPQIPRSKQLQKPQQTAATLRFSHLFPFVLKSLKRRRAQEHTQSFHIHTSSQLYQWNHACAHTKKGLMKKITTMTCRQTMTMGTAKEKGWRINCSCVYRSEIISHAKLNFAFVSDHSGNFVHGCRASGSKAADAISRNRAIGGSALPYASHRDHPSASLQPRYGHSLRILRLQCVLIEGQLLRVKMHLCLSLPDMDFMALFHTNVLQRKISGEQNPVAGSMPLIQRNLGPVDHFSAKVVRSLFCQRRRPEISNAGHREDASKPRDFRLERETTEQPLGSQKRQRKPPAGG